VHPGPSSSGPERTEHVLTRQRLRERLEALVRAIPTGASGRTTTHVVEGNVTDALLSCPAQKRADLIVLGSLPREAPREERLESIAGYLTQRASCPVLTVPPRASGPVPRLKHIVLALEPAPTVGLSVEWTTYWARRFGAVVQLLYRERAGAAGAEAMYRDEIEERLRREGVGLERTDTEPESRMAERIVERAESGRCDLVIMSVVRRESEVNALEALRRTAVVPVLSVRDFTPDHRAVDDTKS
jgi:hypothetical protein